MSSAAWLWVNALFARELEDYVPRAAPSLLRA